MQFVDETDSDRGMMFSQQFTFNRQTGQHCPIIVNPFHPKTKRDVVKQWAFKLNSAVVAAETWH